MGKLSGEDETGLEPSTRGASARGLVEFPNPNLGRQTFDSDHRTGLRGLALYLTCHRSRTTVWEEALLVYGNEIAARVSMM